MFLIGKGVRMEVLPVQAKLNADVKADVSPFVRATADVVSSSHKGVGKILNALFGKWIAKRERPMLLLQAQTEKDCADIKHGVKIYKEGQLLDGPNITTAVDVYDALHTLNHMADARRMQAAMEEAMRQISEVPADQISDEPISQTFFNRWRREAEMIDEEYLRRIWAGLLKEEAVSTNNITPQTLDVLKNLSKDDCDKFMGLCRGALEGELIVSYDNHPVFGSYDDVVALQEIGLLSNLQASARFESDTQKDEVLICFRGSSLGIRLYTKDLSVHTFSITRVGRDLLRVIGNPVVSDTDVRAIADYISTHGLGGLREKNVTIVKDSHVLECEGWHWIRGHRPACWE